MLCSVYDALLLFLLSLLLFQNISTMVCVQNNAEISFLCTLPFQSTTNYCIRIQIIPVDGGTFTQFAYSFKQMSIEPKFANVSDLGEIKSLINEDTKANYIENLANPSGTIPDFAAMKAIAMEAKVPLICDNTFGMGGYTCRPLKFGADIVV
mmetsp:Transcript_24954/g.34903  ORF Transcript_24954/g.34903 Transcript_24954/m.34903 type:complete len:152 (+) Transcript_24954:607-1062(+)